MVLLVALTLMAPVELAWPLEGDLTSKFGPRWGQLHEGIDISAREGRWVRSAAAGMVIFAGQYGLYGNLVTVRHADGLKTFYAHLKNYCVFRGQRIRKGQKVGRVGSTGRSTGPHLHFEVRWNRAVQDPLSWLPARVIGEAQGAVGGP